MAEINVEVRANRIVGTKSGTEFSVTYEKRDDANNIIMTCTWVPSNMASEFRAQAFQAALIKARELGWVGPD